ncbi:MAG: J domain-containing protein [Proteobacteria bacterium]|nr:J domain-containing protein [Pseudomonadota bacterium]MBS0218590.1 J domain-containing protein [Pseudomonadota bacterium]MBS0226822.1 J domain-containing protein [Pseudomonadota bacterium]
MASDFTSLYASLGVDPDCDVETLKRLFRRRIAELHPDRGATLSEEELMLLYLEALRFHRRHGRFPGTRIRNGNGNTIRLAAMEPRSPRQELVAMPAIPGGDGTSRQQVMTVTLLTLLGLVLLGFGIWAIDDDDPVSAGAGPQHIAPAG